MAETTNLANPAEEAAQRALYSVFGCISERKSFRLEAGAGVNARCEDGETALMVAAITGLLEVIGVLLEAGADVNETSKFGLTALIGAKREGRSDCVKLLLDAGADVNTQDVGWPVRVRNQLFFQDVGWTALMKAAHWGYFEIVQLLLNAEADMNVRNEDGETALTIAIKRNNTEVERLLRNAGAKE